MAKEDYLVKEAAEIVGISVRALQFYVEKGLIVPDQPAWGKGTRRKFSKRNILEVLILRELQANGFQLDQVRKVMEQLRYMKLGDYVPLDPDSAAWDEAPTLFLLVFDRDHAVFDWGDPEGNINLVMGDRTSVTAINVAILREKVGGL